MKVIGLALVPFAVTLLYAASSVVVAAHRAYEAAASGGCNHDQHADEYPCFDSVPHGVAPCLTIAGSVPV